MIQFGRSNISLSREQEQQYGNNKSTLFLTRDLSLKTLPRGSKKKTVTSSTLYLCCTLLLLQATNGNLKIEKNIKISISPIDIQVSIIDLVYQASYISSNFFYKEFASVQQGLNLECDLSDIYPSHLYVIADI